MKCLSFRSVAFIYLALIASLLLKPALVEASDFVSFQEGVNGYVGTQDTWIHEGEGDHGADVTLFWDGPTGVGSINPLLRFDNIIGNGAGQIPLGSTILSATLTLHVDPVENNFGEATNLHRMLVPWSEFDTYASLVGGVSLDDIEAVAVSDATTSSGQSTPIVADVTLSVQQWTNGDANFGWFLDQPTADGVNVVSSEGITLSVRPQLSVEFVPIPEPTAVVLALCGLLCIVAFRSAKE